MRIVQITDIHIDKLFELNKNIDVHQNFLRILEDALLHKPDLIVLSGDLCHNEAQINVYQWFKSELSGRGLPYRVIGGNHDDGEMLTSTFKDVQGNLPYFAYQTTRQKLLFLNTISGNLDEIQWEWLKNHLKEPVSAIFMHHPPLLAGIPHMDNYYAMRNRDSFLQLLKSFDQRFRIFTGHYHNDRTIEVDNISVYITPSTFFQISDKSQQLTYDHFLPGYRIIDLYDDGGFKTWVRYLW